jgi:plasmid stabilization system protein ParE
MKVSLHRADEFNADFDQQYRWYLAEAGEETAERFLRAATNTLLLLSEQPDLGRRRKFRHPLLHGLRSIQVDPPFNRLLVFYRHSKTEVVAERLMHGARDLPRRLSEPLS